MYLCIDSGGTKISYAIFDENFILKNEYVIIMNGNYRLNQKEVENVFLKIFYDLTPTKVLIGMAGIYGMDKEIENFQKKNNIRIDIVSDISLASLSINLKEGQILGMLGTGSVFYKDNRIEGGYGHLLGDEGSGYHFGKIILKKYLKLKQLNISNIITKEIEKNYGINSSRELVPIIYISPKVEFSKLAKTFMDNENFRDLSNIFFEETSNYIDDFAAHKVYLSGSITNSIEFQKFIKKNKKNYEIVKIEMLDGIKNYEF